MGVMDSLGLAMIVGLTAITGDIIEKKHVTEEIVEYTSNKPDIVFGEDIEQTTIAHIEDDRINSTDHGKEDGPNRHAMGDKKNDTITTESTENIDFTKNLSTQLDSNITIDQWINDQVILPKYNL